MALKDKNVTLLIIHTTEGKGVWSIQSGGLLSVKGTPWMTESMDAQVTNVDGGKVGGRF